MKKIKNYFKIILILIAISTFKIIDVHAASNPYSKTGPYGTNCTWYAWKMANEKAGIALPGWGNAKNWYNDAKNDGYSVGTTPKANSIIVWGGWTSYGHVGYVEKVEDNILHVWDSTGPCIDEEDEEYRECMANGVSEESDRICRANAKRKACEYTISPDEYGITGYVYLDEAPKKPTPPVSQNNNSNQNNNSTNPTVTKSSNTNLSNIELSHGTIIFDKKVLEYNLEVENKITKITVNATLEDKKSTIKGTGEYELNIGLNEIKLLVTAENKSTKEYVINVTRNEKKEIEVNTEINNNSKDEGKINSNKSNNESKDKSNQKIIILVSSISFLILFSISLIFIKRKNVLNNGKNS